MITFIDGLPGSGKSLFLARMIVKCAEKRKVFGNIAIKKKIPNYERLKWDMIMAKTLDEKGKEKLEVNWEFWNRPENRNCDIFIDEMQQAASNRDFASKRNKCWGSWVSQIRKIWGSTGNFNAINNLQRFNNAVFSYFIDDVLTMSPNLWLSTQRAHKVDLYFRELCQVLIRCEKVSENPCILMNEFYFANRHEDAISMGELGLIKPKRRLYDARPFFNYYDSYELVGSQSGMI